MNEEVLSVEFEGSEFKLSNKRTLIIPPVSFGDLRKNGGLKKFQEVEKRFKEMAETREFSQLTEDDLGNISSLIWMAAKRNYPDITQDEIEESIDLGKAQKIIPGLLIQNQFSILPKSEGNEQTQRVTTKK
jgi:hypothetical protein